MLDLPLHPIIVHFPMVLGSLLPLLAIGLWWTIHKAHWTHSVTLGQGPACVTLAGECDSSIAP